MIGNKKNFTHGESYMIPNKLVAFYTMGLKVEVVQVSLVIVGGKKYLDIF